MGAIGGPDDEEPAPCGVIVGNRIVRVGIIGPLDPRNEHTAFAAEPMRLSCISTMRWGSFVVTLLVVLPACGHGYTLPRTQGVDPPSQVEKGQLSVEKMELAGTVCTGLDLRPEYAALDDQSIVGFLKARGLPVRTERARADLSYVEVQVNPEKDEWVRLRVATLGSAIQAGRELDDAITQHGKGSWGVHRSNIAVLGPKGSVDNIVALIGKTKLSCWGVLTVGDGDESFAIRGNYREL